MVECQYTWADTNMMVVHLRSDKVRLVHMAKDYKDRPDP